MIPPKNILIVRTDRIGDVVLSLPMASVLKKHFPQSKITFLLREYTKPLAENNQYIDEVLALKFEKGKFLLAENIKQLKNKFDLCIAAYPTFQIALLLYLADIKTRVGTGYRWYSFLFNKKIYDHRKLVEHHELEYNIRLLKAIGIEHDINPENVEYSLQPSQKSRQAINNLFISEKINAGKPIVIVHPGSGGSSIDLPIESMKMLVNRLARESDVKIMITGNEKEKELCQMFVVDEKTRNFAGRFELANLIALIERSDLMIANSTGPIHIASALNKYVIGFYPKILVCSEERWGPYTNKKKIFKPEIDCNDCTTQQCAKLNCMTSINIDNVFEAVKSFLLKDETEKK